MKFLMRFVIGLLIRSYRYVGFVRDFLRMKRLLDRAGESRFEFCWSKRYPCLNDPTTRAGFDAHYVYHTGWAARVLVRRMPTSHVDISSSLYFVSIASAFLPIQFYDYRPNQ